MQLHILQCPLWPCQGEMRGFLSLPCDQPSSLHNNSQCVQFSQFCCVRFCRYTQPPPELWAFQALPVCFCMEILEPFCSAKLCTVFLSSSLNTDAKANAKSPQLLFACCICTAGFLIRKWGACGQNNQESFCCVFLLIFVSRLS